MIKKKIMNYELTISPTAHSFTTHFIARFLRKVKGLHRKGDKGEMTFGSLPAEIKNWVPSIFYFHTIEVTSPYHPFHSLNQNKTKTDAYGYEIYNAKGEKGEKTDRRLTT